jgi:hypothetical protein
VSDCTGCQNLSNPTHQGTREMCRIVQDVRTCLIRHTKGPGKCVGSYRMSEYSGFNLVNRNTLGVELHKFHCILISKIKFYWKKRVVKRIRDHGKLSYITELIFLNKYSGVWRRLWYSSYSLCMKLDLNLRGRRGPFLWNQCLLPLTLWVWIPHKMRCTWYNTW